MMLPLRVHSVLVAVGKRALPPPAPCHDTTSGSSRSPSLNEAARRGPSFGLFFFSFIFLLWKMSSIHKSGIMNGHCSAKVNIPGNTCTESVLDGYHSTVMVTARLLGGQTSGPQVLVPQVPGKPWFPFCKQQMASFGL